MISRLHEWGTYNAEEREETDCLLPCEAVVRGAVDVASRLTSDDVVTAPPVVTTSDRKRLTK